jgi:putative two-component system response regulator
MTNLQKASPELEMCRILVVDDEEGNLSALDRLLRWAGYPWVQTTSDPAEALELFRRIDPDLVLLDLHMPEMDGFQVLSRLAGELAADEYLPVLILTGDSDPEMRQRALAAGARDFVTKPFESTEVLLRIKNLLETRTLHLRLQRHRGELERRVMERTRELAEAQLEILKRLARAAEYRDDVTGQHAERVGALSAVLAEELALPREQVELIRLAAPLHDVGKIGIPDAILMKPGALTPEEYAMMKTHTDVGARILSGSSFPILKTAEIIARSHHERWDGKGYMGMSGETIPIEGRIVAVADVFDSLTNERPYKGALSVDDTVAIIREERGGHFDPAVVDAFMRAFESGRILNMGIFLARAVTQDGVRPEDTMDLMPAFRSRPRDTPASELYGSQILPPH